MYLYVHSIFDHLQLCVSVRRSRDVLAARACDWLHAARVCVLRHHTHMQNKRSAQAGVRPNMRSTHTHTLIHIVVVGVGGGVRVARARGECD